MKEFNNRWFLIGRRKKNQPITNVALDRIIAIDYDFNMPHLKENFNADTYYKNVVGVTVNTSLHPNRFELWIDALNAPYVLTKPLLNSQQLIKQNEDGSIIIHLFVILNYELARIFLGFGNGLEVIRPDYFRNQMKSVIQKSLARYAE